MASMRFQPALSIRTDLENGSGATSLQSALYGQRYHHPRNDLEHDIRHVGDWAVNYPKCSNLEIEESDMSGDPSQSFLTNTVQNVLTAPSTPRTFALGPYTSSLPIFTLSGAISPARPASSVSSCSDCALPSPRYEPSRAPGNSISLAAQSRISSSSTPSTAYSSTHTHAGDERGDSHSIDTENTPPGESHDGHNTDVFHAPNPLLLQWQTLHARQSQPTFYVPGVPLPSFPWSTWDRSPGVNEARSVGPGQVAPPS